MTPMMRTVLGWIAAGHGSHYCCHGKSEHGGRARIIMALRQRGLIDHDWQITDAGRKYLKDTKQGG